MECSWQYLAVLLVRVLVVLQVGAASSDESRTAHPAGHTPHADGDRRLVVNTWTGDFSSATARAWDVLCSKDGVVLDAVEQGCNVCEDIRCGGSVGYGGRPDTSDEVTLDSMIMYGPSHRVGAVGYLRRIKNAATVARAVMEHTEHTMLAGDGATAFAKMMGLHEEDLGTDDSHKDYRAWTENNCQPNYYRNFIGAGDSCPPYDRPTSPAFAPEARAAASLPPESEEFPRAGRSEDPARFLISENNHDTIGIVVVDEAGDLACGTTTNGAANKIAGRVGDSPVAGAGCYVDNDVGGAAATGDGDVMMRFLPSFRAVERMRAGASPQDACAEALCSIARFYPTFGGALVCANKTGAHGAARHGLSFAYSYQSAGHDVPQVAQAIEIDEQVCADLKKSAWRDS
eukprot:g3643.t1